MKIIVLDGATLNPGDLSWDALGELGPCRVHPRTPADQVVSRMGHAEVAITNKVVFDAATIEALPALRYIGVTATGFNVIDTDAAAARGIVVTNVPTYGTQSVAQMVFALLLELCHRVGHHSETVRRGRWAASDNFCYWDYPLVELAGLTMGIVGFGRIGQATAKLAEAFGMTVQAHDVRREPIDRAGVCYADLDTLFATSDVVSLHCPLTPQTEGLVDAERIATMKPSAFLINTSRGPLIREADLAEALASDRLAGAAVDVLSTEPPAADNPLPLAKNCIVTPHIAWATRSARQRLMDTVVANLKAWIDGRPVNVVN